MREWVTTALDVLGLMLIAAGAGLAAGVLVGWSALAVSGVVVLAGSQVAAWFRDRPVGGP